MLLHRALNNPMMFLSFSSGTDTELDRKTFSSKFLCFFLVVSFFLKRIQKRLFVKHSQFNKEQPEN